MDRAPLIGKLVWLIAVLIIASMNAALAAEYSETHTLPLGNLTGGQEKWHVTAFQDDSGKTQTTKRKPVFQLKTITPREKSITRTSK
jgi:hypothetical protein